MTGPERRHLYGPEGEVQVTAGGISVSGELVPALAAFGTEATPALRGRHNLDNLCGAITASRLLTGAWPDFESLAAAVGRMSPLSSRLETVACSGGVEFVDDTLASNPAGTIAALEAFRGRRVSLIAGGHDRGTDLRGLARALDAFGEVIVVFLGEAGERLSRELDEMSSRVACVRARNVSEALELAVDALDRAFAGAGDSRGAGDSGGAVRGGVVLFSPAAPTPPSQGTYVERSAEFRRAVRQHVDMHGDGDSAAC